jgi:hypothetical protein
MSPSFRNSEECDARSAFVRPVELRGKEFLVIPHGAARSGEPSFHWSPWLTSNAAGH